MNPTFYNRTAAEVAAAAFTELFPGIELVGGGETTLGFSFDFLCSAPLPAEAEVLIEEKMRQIVREKRPIRVLEMVPFSARELLLKEGHYLRAEALDEEKGGEDGLVQVIQIGTYHNLSSGPHLSSTSHLGAFKLWPLQKGERTLRLSGCAFPSKEELKKFIKLQREYPEKSHERVGLKKSLWRLLDGQIVWLPEGLKRQATILETVRQNLFDRFLEISFPSDSGSDEARVRLAQELNPDGIAEVYSEPRPPWDLETGLFAGEGGVQIRVTLPISFGNWSDKVNSSLQSTAKTLNILGFQHCLRLKGGKRSGKAVKTLILALESQGMVVEVDPEESSAPRLDFMVGDHLGRQWAAFSIELAVKVIFITASVERLVALLLEMKTQTNER